MFNVIKDEGLLDDLDFTENEEVIEEPKELGGIFDDVPVESLEDSNAVLDFLNSRGFSEGKVKVVNEEGVSEEVDFNSLSKQEQLDILNTLEDGTSDEDDLDDSEVELLNYIRSNGLTVDQFLEGYRESILTEAGLSNSPVYEIDNYDDNELFLLDLHQKYDLNEEELQLELEKELQNPDLFKKKIDAIRDEYKQLEDNYKESQIQAAETQRQEQYSSLVQTMGTIASNNPVLYGLELEDSEKYEVLSFLLDLDKNGVSQFYKTLNDPQKLYEAAWFLRYGKESFDVIQSAYEAEISRLKQDSRKTKVDIVGKNNNEPKSLFEIN